MNENPIILLTYPSTNSSLLHNIHSSNDLKYLLLFCMPNVEDEECSFAIDPIDRYRIKMKIYWLAK